MKNKKIMMVLLFLIAISLIVNAAQLNSSNYQITAAVVSSGGTNTTSANYKNDLVLGTIAGNITSTLYKLFLGFF